MTNIRNEVWKRIDADPSIQLDLERGIVNVRALARHFQDTGVPGSKEAVISAIRRYPRTSAKSWYETARSIVAQSHVSTKSHIVLIELSKGGEVQDILAELFDLVRYEKGETLRIVQGEESIRLLVDEKNREKMLEKIPEKSVLNVYRDLAEINVHLHPQGAKTPGIVYVISGELARHHINMYEMLGGAPEILIFVEEKKLMAAYNALFELCHQ
ncbi:ACT domain-containing protein [Candidatus Micrarchaeota archaeon]|nr:ACT domain-containing protein [Candidatus Micrarchaeota archaeon]